MLKIKYAEYVHVKIMERLIENTEAWDNGTEFIE